MGFDGLGPCLGKCQWGEVRAAQGVEQTADPEFLLNSLPLCPTGLTNIMFQKLPQGKQENLPATRDLILHTGLGPG